MIFKKKKSKKIDLTEKDKEQFIKTLSVIREILSKNDSQNQSEVVNDILCLLEEDDYKRFVDFLNHENMWGGAGAVWETYIENTETQNRFQSNIVELIELMESLGVSKVGSGSIKKAYSK